MFDPPTHNRPMADNRYKMGIDGVPNRTRKYWAYSLCTIRGRTKDGLWSCVDTRLLFAQRLRIGFCKRFVSMIEKLKACVNV